MVPVAYDEATKRFSPVEAKEKAKGQKQAYSPRVKIGGELLDTLLLFAKEDGFTLTRNGKDGKPVQDRGKTTKAVSMYVEQAVREFAQNRARAGK